MEIADGRGRNKAKIGVKNLDRVRNYFKKHPDNTKTECSRQLDLSFKTVLKHVRTMQKEG